MLSSGVRMTADLPDQQTAPTGGATFLGTMATARMVGCAVGRMPYNGSERLAHLQRGLKLISQGPGRSLTHREASPRPLGVVAARLDNCAPHCAKGSRAAAFGCREPTGRSMKCAGHPTGTDTLPVSRPVMIVRVTALPVLPVSLSSRARLHRMSPAYPEAVVAISSHESA